MRIARIGAAAVCGMQVVKVSPPYDVNDTTSQLARRVILDVLASMVVAGKLGHREGGDAVGAGPQKGP